MFQSRNETQLVKRVTSAARKAINKTTDAARVVDMVRNKKVFYSAHPNEITIDNSDKSAEQVAGLILDELNSMLLT